MDRLITILRAAHCRSTHHFFVVDAIPLVATDQGKRLASQLLKHYKQYLIGAKAPDKEFRDFRNHVVHVNDNHWGGAPKAAQEWYGHLVRKIRQARWSEAAYCAGVVSHYFTDPLMPLHTAQSERESVVHRPLEWSVTKSYNRILDRYRDGQHKVVFEIARDDGWLGGAVTAGARLANRHYDDLIERYDLAKGTRRPEDGLDDLSIDVLAGLFGVALTGWARIIERVADESGVAIPEAPLSVASLVASISMPVAWIVRRIESSSEQQAVRAIFDEYRATGKVTENLPTEVKVVRAERQRDQSPTSSRAVSTRPIALRETPASRTVAAQPTSSVPIHAAATTNRSKGVNLALSDDLVDAPSIGPKTAKRFAAIGITTVEQFLEQSPQTMADKLQTRWVKPEMIRDWQDQARLVATVPGLCGYKAQLLVGVECRDGQTLASEVDSNLHDRIQRYASTKAGKRSLRSSRVPSRDDVAQWIGDASSRQRKRSA